MILIADSGTTKTEWCKITDEGTTEILVTSGINPFYQESDNIITILQKEFTGLKKFDAIYFYGAGCANREKQSIVERALLQVFETNNITIGSDLLAAARALCQHKAGVACILGTGSNSCYYDGREITDNVSPLGFILGDEGSGAVMGKKLIGDVLKKQLPAPVISDFFNTYGVSAAEILENVYKKPFPSRYLAGYTRFLSKHIAKEEIQELVITSLREFISRNLLQYKGIDKNPVHFTGSIAYFFKSQLEIAIKEHRLTLGTVEQAPMNGLIKFHQNE